MIHILCYLKCLFLHINYVQELCYLIIVLSINILHNLNCYLVFFFDYCSLEFTNFLSYLKANDCFCFVQKIHSILCLYVAHYETIKNYLNKVKKTILSPFSFNGIASHLLYSLTFLYHWYKRSNLQSIFLKSQLLAINV